MGDYNLFVLIVVITLTFEFSNGWHDAANSIATVVSTRVLKPLPAVIWAAFWNFVAAYAFGVAVAKTMGKGLVRLDVVNEEVILAGLLGAIVWNMITLVLGLPTSSSHALMGGYGGAAVAKAGLGAILIDGWIKPLFFIPVAPFIGMGAAMLVTVVTTWLVRNIAPQRVDRWFRRLQLLSAAGYSIGHGTNDAQKGMGIIWAAMVSGGMLSTHEAHPPWWVVIACHAAIAGGTMAGGWKLVKTMGQKITKLSPFGGFAAETAGAITLFGTSHAGIPVSTTHTITGCIIGVGAAHRLTAVRWGVTGRVMLAWILTMPGAATFGVILYGILHAVLR